MIHFHLFSPSRCTVLTLSDCRECIEPAPSPSFTCNNETGQWEIETLIVPNGETITFETPSLVLGDLTFHPGATAIFKGDHLLFVDGFATISAALILDFGKSKDEGLFSTLVSEKLKSITLISGGSGFQVSSAHLTLAYTGGCTSISGSLNVDHHAEHSHPSKLVVSHIKRKGTGNCHWVWSTLSLIATLATLIIVPLIERYAWKIYD